MSSRQRLRRYRHAGAGANRPHDDPTRAQADAPVEPNVAASDAVTLAELKDWTAAANVAIAEAGLVALSFGNLSAVDRETGILVIKPSGVPYAGLTGRDMVAVALHDGRVVDGKLRPSTDTPTHRFLYREFPEIGAVVHTHSTYATSFALASRSLGCSYEALVRQDMTDGIPLAKYGPRDPMSWHHARRLLSRLSPG